MRFCSQLSTNTAVFRLRLALKDTTSSAIIKCLEQLFNIFGCPSYLHSDRGSSFNPASSKNSVLRRALHSRVPLLIIHKETGKTNAIMALFGKPYPV